MKILLTLIGCLLFLSANAQVSGQSDTLFRRNGGRGLSDNNYTDADKDKVGQIVTPEQFGAVGNGVTVDAIAINNALAALEAAGGGQLRFKEGKTYLIDRPLIVGSNTRITLYGAKVYLKDNSNCNMLLSSAYVAGTGRTVNVQLEGGIWDRGTNGGVNNNNHTLFFRQVDGLSIRDLKVLTARNVAKYAISIANCNYIECRHLAFDTGSDGIHFCGPVNHAIVDDITGYLGDDAVAVTTVDYAQLADTQGDVTDLRISNVEVSNATRAILLGCTGFAIRDVTIQNVIQHGTGAGVTIGDGGFYGGTVDRISISDLLGGPVLVRHNSIGHLTVNRATSVTSPVAFAREAVGGICTVVQATLNNLVSTGSQPAVFVDNYATVKRLVMTNCEAGKTLFSSNGSVIGTLSIQGSALELTGDFMSLVGNIDRLLVSDCSVKTLTSTATGITIGSSTTIGSITVQASSFTAVDSNTGDLIRVSGGTVGVVNVANCTLLNTSRVFQQSTGAPLSVVNISNLVATGNDRLVETGSPVEINYSNLNLISQIHQPFRTSHAAASMVIRGEAFSGYTSSAVVRSSTETIRVNAPDFPVDISVLTPANGDRVQNTNGSGLTPAGTLQYDGVSWISQSAQPRVLASVPGINSLSAGSTTLYTVPAGKVLIVTGVTVRSTASNGITGALSADVGRPGAGGEIFPNQSTALTATDFSYAMVNTSSRKSLTAGQVVNFTINTAAVGTSQTVTVELLGYLR